MNALIMSEIQDRLKSIPDEYANEILSYIDYLNVKKSISFLPEDEISLILKGKEDILKGRTFTHTQAKSIIEHHIQSKMK
jgi:hypothetical protein